MAVTPTTIAVALGRTAPEVDSAEYLQWDMWISDALMLISARLVGDGTGQVASLAELDQDALDYVVRESVVAQIRRPDDATQVAVSVDDGSVSRTYRTARGRVTILDEWWDLLSPTDSSAGAFSIRPYGSGTCHSDVCSANTYVAANGAIMFGGAYCTCGAEYAGYPLYESDGYW
jgi:hypothetical protein